MTLAAQLTVVCSLAKARAWKLSKFFKAVSWSPAPKVMAFAMTPAHWSVPEVATGRSMLEAPAFPEIARVARAAQNRQILHHSPRFDLRCQWLGGSCKSLLRPMKLPGSSQQHILQLSLPEHVVCDALASVTVRGPS